MDAAGPKPSAGVPGTTMLVEDMFYNVPARQKAIRSGSEEHARILDMVGRYAVYATRVGITVKRAGEARPDLHTTAGAGQLDAIRHASAEAKGLVHQMLSVGGTSEPRGCVGSSTVPTWWPATVAISNNSRSCVVQGCVRLLGVQASPCVRADRGLRRILATC